METTKNELFLRTVFACMACDGEIAPEEVALVKELTGQSNLFATIDVENKLNEYIRLINEQGKTFLQTYLADVSNSSLEESDELQLVSLAFQTIEADKKIEYSK